MSASRNKNRKSKTPGGTATPAEDDATAAALVQPEQMNSPFLLAKSQLQRLVPKKEPPRATPAKGGPAKVSKAPPAPVKPPEPKPPSEEELFRQEMWGVRPIVDPRSARAGRRAPDPVDVPPRPRVSEEAEVLAQLADLCDGSGPWDIADSDEFIEGLAPGIDRRILQRLRRGEFAIQGHVDLHGQTSEQARETIERFVQESRVNGQRCVLIIHGRGLNSKDQIPVLKERVRVWLTRGRIARSVLAYATARPADGGAGAVYVLLRK